jgi:hypothetical protein
MIPAMDETMHDFLEFVRCELSVCSADEDLGDELFEEDPDIVQAFDAVMKVVDLPSSPYLATYGFGKDGFREFLDVRFDRQPVIGGSLQHGHIPDFQQGHVKRTRYRGRGQDEAIHRIFSFP